MFFRSFQAMISIGITLLNPLLQVTRNIISKFLFMPTTASINGLTFSFVGALVSQVSYKKLEAITNSTSVFMSSVGLFCSALDFTRLLREDECEISSLTSSSVLLLCSFAQFGLSGYKMFKLLRRYHENTLRERHQLDVVRYLGDRVVISVNPLVE